MNKSLNFMLAIFLLCVTLPQAAQGQLTLPADLGELNLADNSNTNDENPRDHSRGYIGTSLFILTSLIPDDNTFFYEIDYGHRLNEKSDLLIGLDVYQYTTPMSSPWTDTTTYDGYVLSYGIIVGYQRYVWKKLYLLPMANLLKLDYFDEDRSKVGSGMMLLCTGRVGYHIDFKTFGQPFYLEPGCEYNFWPINTNVPADFKTLDDKYGNSVFSPAINIGWMF